MKIKSIFSRDKRDIGTLISIFELILTFRQILSEIWRRHLREDRPSNNWCRKKFSVEVRFLISLLTPFVNSYYFTDTIFGASLENFVEIPTAVMMMADFIAEAGIQVSKLLITLR